MFHVSLATMIGGLLSALICRITTPLHAILTGNFVEMRRNTTNGMGDSRCRLRRKPYEKDPISPEKER